MLVDEGHGFEIGQGRARQAHKDLPQTAARMNADAEALKLTWTGSSVEALTVEICRAPKPVGSVRGKSVAMRNTPAADRSARGAPGKLSAAERSALNQALSKALAFRDAGKMPEARQWAAELVRLLKSHDLLV